MSHISRSEAERRPFINRQWRLAARPVGLVREADFQLTQEPVPAPAEGQILVRNLVLSFEPSMRSWMADRKSYVPPVQLGEVMRSLAVGQVVQSQSGRFQAGELVQGLFGWQDYAVVAGDASVQQVAPDELTMSLGVLGMTGMTAYFGLLDVGRPQPGETVVVSGAAGATGSVAAQVARIQGCRVIGVAGGADKCRWLREEAGLDGVIDYKVAGVDLEAELRRLCPEGIHVYFDNVGGPLLEVVLGRLARRGRIVLCGGISAYNEAVPPPGPRNLLNLVVQRGRMEGFLVLDYAARFGEAQVALRRWVKEGRMRHQEDIQDGLENAPRTLLRLFAGQNHGKQLLRIAEPT